MANICHTSVAVFGERSELEALAGYIDRFKESFDIEHPEYARYGIFERDLAEKFGYEAEDEYDANGWISSWELEEDCLRLWQEDRWGPKTYFWYHITRQFDGLYYVYYASCPMSGIFDCTDDEHRFFQYTKFTVDFVTLDDRYLSIRGGGNTEEELLADINGNYHTNFRSARDIMRYYESIPGEFLDPDPMGMDFVFFRNPWKNEGNPFYDDDGFEN